MCEGKIDFTSLKLSTHQLGSLASFLENSFSQWKEYVAATGGDDELIKLFGEAQAKAKDFSSAAEKVFMKLNDEAHGTSATITPV